MADTTFIYGLYCPTSQQVRYIGKSNKPAHRFRQHVNRVKQLRTHRSLGLGCQNNHKADKQDEWIDGLLEQGLEPSLVIFEEVPAQADIWRAAERKWIRHMESQGHQLLNVVGLAANDEEEIVRKGVELGRKLAKALDVDPTELVS